MDHPKKGHSSKESKIKLLANIDEVKALAKQIVEVNEALLENIDDPLEFYSQSMKLRWCSDLKAFSKRLIEGYGVLLQQLSGEDQSNEPQSEG